jgi:succinoglycan biosynthesis protein ExoO
MTQFQAQRRSKERQRVAIPRPDVSFIVAAHNVAPFVEPAVTSALAQEGVDVEVVVVDDASTDRTAEVVASLAERDARIRLVRRTAKGGPAVARNTAMDMASGTWLAILDADDLLLPKRSRRLMDLATATGADVVADNFERFSERYPQRSTMIAKDAHPYAFFVDVASMLMGNLMFDRRARLGYMKAMLRTEFLRAHSIRHPEDILIGEDYHLLLSCLLAGARFLVTSETYYRYRVRDGSISYRLSVSDVDRLLEEHAKAGIERRWRDDEVRRAARAYVQALERARDVVSIIDQAKTGAWGAALAGASRNARTWPLLARFGGAALRKRIWPIA